MTRCRKQLIIVSQMQCIESAVISLQITWRNLDFQSFALIQDTESEGYSIKLHQYLITDKTKQLAS